MAQSSMQAYLAAKYMSGAKAEAILARAEDSIGKKKKKRKRRDGEDGSISMAAQTGSGIFIDDGDVDWRIKEKNEDEEDDRPVQLEHDGSFKAAKKAAWEKVHTGNTPPPEEEPEAADEKPVVVMGEPSEPPRRGGLMSAAQLQADEDVAKEEERRREAARRERETTEERQLALQAQETVYRDSTGKKVDLKAEKAEKRRLQKEKDEREAKKMEWGKGVVQKSEKEEMARKLREEKGKDVARYANDIELNNDLKAVERFNDPAANFLTKKKSTGPQFPKYQGPWAPNRFNIPPGHRWDGVDRGNGFERKRYDSINARQRRTKEGYEYGAEDM